MDLDQFPLLMPISKDMLEYEGFIEIGSLEYECRIEKTSNGKAFQIVLSSDLLEHFPRKLFTQYLKPAQDIKDLSKILFDVIKRCNAYLRQSKTPYGAARRLKGVKKSSSTFFVQILSELDSIGWDKVVDIAIDLSNLTLNLSGGHKLIFHFDTDSYPRTKPKVEAPYYPDDFIFPWSEQSKLTNIIDYYRKQCTKFGFFWAVMSDLDANCWIEDPTQANPGHTHRRIRLARNCSIIVEIAPHNPASQPTVKFLGADSVVNPLLEKYRNNWVGWNQGLELEGDDSEQDPRVVRLGLEKVLGVSFPRPKEEGQEEGLEDEEERMCGICYMEDFDGALPDKMCNNPKCGKRFHESCLASWLGAVPSNTLGMLSRKIRGKCVFCEEEIEVDVKEY